MADLQNWISCLFLEPLRLSLFNRRTRALALSQEDSVLSRSGIQTNNFLREITPQTLPDKLSQYQLYNLIYDSAKYVFTHFGTTFNCMSVHNSNILKNYHLFAAVDEPISKLTVEDRPQIVHSQLSKFLLFFMHPFQMMSDESSKPSFPTLSRSLPDGNMERTFLMSVCGSKFTRGKFCFTSNIAPITNIEVGLKADEFEVAEIAEEFFAKNGPSTSSPQEVFMKETNNGFENKPDQCDVQQFLKDEQRTSTKNNPCREFDEDLLVRDRQRKQAKKRKNRRRKQNRKNREDSSSSKGSTGSSTPESDFESDNGNSLQIAEFMEIEEDCDIMMGDPLLLVGSPEEPHRCSPDSHENFLLSWDKDSFSEDEDEEEDEDEIDCGNVQIPNEELEQLFFNPLSTSNLHKSRPVDLKPSTSSSTCPINIKPSPSHQSFNCISPSPDYTVFWTADDIRRNNERDIHDAILKKEMIAANSRWEKFCEDYIDCSRCQESIEGLIGQPITAHKQPMHCPLKSSKVKFSEVVTSFTKHEEDYGQGVYDEEYEEEFEKDHEDSEEDEDY